MINFPNAPIHGQQFTAGNQTWEYSSTKSRWALVPVSTSDANSAAASALTAASIKRQIEEMLAGLGTGGTVVSVNGESGVVTLTPAKLGLGSVDNTRDADKPISTATQTALDAKLSDAPSDGKLYGRKNAVWQEVVAGTGGGGDGINAATQAALDGKASLAGAIFTGGVNITAEGLSVTDGIGVEGGLYASGGMSLAGDFNLDEGKLNILSGEGIYCMGRIDVLSDGMSVTDGLQINSGGLNVIGGLEVQGTGASIDGRVTVSSGGLEVYEALFVQSGGASILGNVYVGGRFIVEGSAVTPMVIVNYSPTPVFDASKSNSFRIAHLGNITSSSIINEFDGQTISIRFKQDAVGGRTVVLPANVKAAGAPETGANRVSILVLTYVGGPEARWEGGWQVVPA